MIEIQITYPTSPTEQKRTVEYVVLPYHESGEGKVQLNLKACVFCGKLHNRIRSRFCSNQCKWTMQNGKGGE